MHMGIIDIVFTEYEWNKGILELKFMTVENILKRVSEELKDVPGIVGIVLGGSRARGTNSPTADIDIGIYYDESARFNTEEVSKIATQLDDDSSNDSFNLEFE